jgi:hypothetical protein
MVCATHLDTHSSVGQHLRDIASLQNAEPWISDIKEKLVNEPWPPSMIYKLSGGILYCLETNHYPSWRPVLANNLENKIMHYVHTSLGHLGAEKCMAEIRQWFQVRNLGRKVRKFISCCDTCQRVKHSSRSYGTEVRNHPPPKPGSLCALDIYGL